jgi:histidinol-phosphatase (PHP family)
MTLQNLHTHTVFGDGHDTPEEMTLSAIHLGLTSLGFSEHSPLPPPLDPDGWTMAAADEKTYRDQILQLKSRYAGQLEIFLGLEQDMDSPAPAYPYDYLIGSVHGLWAEGEYLSVDNAPDIFIEDVRRCFGGDYYAYARAYYRRVAEVVERTRCQILGHFDLVTKFNEGDRLFDSSDKRYLSPALEALEALAARDVIFEINTGAMSRGYRSQPYPAEPLLGFLREKGGRVCITSDCHSRENLLYGFHDALSLAKSRGFREQWILTDHDFAPLPI